MANRKVQKNIIRQLKMQPASNVDTIVNDVNRLQDNMGSKLEPLKNVPILNGVLVKSYTLLTGVNNLVEHKLDRAPVGYMIVRQRAQSSIWDSQDDNIYSTSFLSLNCSVDVIVDIWIF